ncbi:MAG: Gfo/Idh/MocA family oxidoreductase [Bacillota bacterium]
MKPRIAVLGLGHGIKHATDLVNSDQGELVAIADADEAKRTTSEKLGARFYTDYKRLLDSEDLDGAIVALPNNLHVEVGIELARRGLHILMEKPLANTSKEAEQVVTAVKSNNVIMLVGHHRRFSSKVQAVREMVQNGELGKILGVSVLWTARKHDAYYSQAKAWHARADMGGGPLLINTIHDIDDIRFICGEVTQVFAFTGHIGRGLPCEDTAAVGLKLENGALVTVFVTDASPALWFYEATAQENPLFWPNTEDCYFFCGTKASIAFPSLRKVYYLTEPRTRVGTLRRSTGLPS